MRYMLIYTGDPDLASGVGRRGRRRVFVLDRGDDPLRGQSAGEPPAANSGCHHDQDQGRRAHHHRRAVRGDQGANSRLRPARVRQPGRGGAVGRQEPPLLGGGGRSARPAGKGPGRAPARAGRRQDLVHDARLHRPGGRPPGVRPHRTGRSLGNRDGRPGRRRTAANWSRPAAPGRYGCGRSAAS